MKKRDEIDYEQFAKDSFNKEIVSYYKKKGVVNDTFIENALIQPNKVTRSLYKCTVTAQKIFCYLVAEFQATKKLRAKVQENGKSDRWVSLDFTLDKYKISDFGGTAQYKLLKSAIKEVCSLQLFIEDDISYTCMNVFEVGTFQKKNPTKLNYQKVEFKFSEEFTNLLENNSKGCFTLCSLDKIAELDSFYSIRYYELAESWRGFEGLIDESNFQSEWTKKNITRPEATWCFGFSIEQLRAMFSLNNKYKETNNFVINVIEKPIEKLNETLDNLEFKVEYKRFGRNQIRGVVFWVTNLDSKKKPRKKFAPQISLWQQYLMKYKVIAEAFLDSVGMVDAYKDLSNEEQEKIAIKLMNDNNYCL